MGKLTSEKELVKEMTCDELCALHHKEKMKEDIEDQMDKKSCRSCKR